MSNSIKEGLLEGGRVVLLAIVSYLLTEGVVALLVNQFIGVQVGPEVRIVAVGAVTSVLRGIDKWLHERAGREEGFLKQGGLTNF